MASGPVDLSVHGGRKARSLSMLCVACLKESNLKIFEGFPKGNVLECLKKERKKLNPENNDFPVKCLLKPMLVPKYSCKSILI